MNIKIVLLCAGYGTRLSRDLETDNSGLYDHLRGVPKPLLPIAHKPLIAHWLDMFEGSDSVSEVIIVTNEYHKLRYELFLQQWMEDEIARKISISIISDGSVSNETRSGAVSCMLLSVQNKAEDTLFLAGDTLFDTNFNLKSLIATHCKLKSAKKDACLLISCPVKEENVSKHGIIEVNEEGRVVNFLEKPQPHETTSRLQSPCCYIISGYSLKYIEEFLEAKKGEPLSQRDATGNFIQYLVTKAPVFTFYIERRFDIGNLNSYIECCQNLS